MRRDGTIIILCAGYGEGHVQVSRTLQRKFGELGFNRVLVVDLFREAHPAMNAFSKFLYAQSPALSDLGFDYYGWSYYWTRDMKQDGMMSKWLGSWGRRKLSDIVRSENPAALISTFPFGGVFEHVRRLSVPVATFTVVTDFTLHNRWLSSKPDRYFVATEDLKNVMEKGGIPKRHISVTGIPIRDTFYEADASVSRERTVLVMAGAFGVLRDIRAMAAQLLELKDAGVTIVCGRNERLQRELELAFAGESRVRVLGYVERVDQLMRSASCMVTKAGGVTLSEAIQTGTPTLIYKPIPGQEKENALYLAEKGWASVSSRIDELVRQAEHMMESGFGEPLRSVRGRLLAGSGHAAEQIVAEVAQSIGEANKARAEAGHTLDIFGGRK